MTGLDIFTFAVFGVIGAAGIASFVVLGSMPGKIAAERNHPQAEAISVAGWIGAITMGILWPFALIWAYTKPRGMNQLAGTEENEDEIGKLRNEVADLRSRIEKLNSQEESSP